MVMASRQLFSLVINSILFGHKLQLSSLPFAAMVFGAMVSAAFPHHFCHFCLWFL